MEHQGNAPDQQIALLSEPRLGPRAGPSSRSQHKNGISDQEHTQITSRRKAQSRQNPNHKPTARPAELQTRRRDDTFTEKRAEGKRTRGRFSRATSGRESRGTQTPKTGARQSRNRHLPHSSQPPFPRPTRTNHEMVAEETRFSPPLPHCCWLLFIPAPSFSGPDTSLLPLVHNSIHSVE